MSLIAQNLCKVRARLEKACRAVGRPLESVTLVAVGKSFAPAALAQALAAGQRDFGENYLQEAAPKITALPREQITWHFIGPVQSNKTREIAAHFDWLHTVDREKIARRLSDQRPAGSPPLNICVQVNISGEDSKSGVTPDQTGALCRTLATLPRLKLRGLMAIPAPAGKEAPRLAYRRLRELYEHLRDEGLELDTLSAGMSDDLEAAIAEGSTMVRIGSAIFGRRS